MPHKAVAQTKRGLFDAVVGDLRNDKDRDPVAGKTADELQRWTEDSCIHVVEKQRLPHINTVGENADVHDGACIEYSANGRRRIADAPEQKKAIAVPQMV